MKRLFQITLLLALPLALPLGCKGDTEEKAEEKIEALPEASNGSPVSAKFVEFIGEGEERGVKVLVYNNGDKTAAGMTILLRYYDASDKLLKVKEGTPFEKDNDFTSVSGGKYKVKPNKNGRFELDGRMLGVPAAATRAEILISKADALGGDGSSIEDWWSQENFSDWPE